MFLQYRNNGFKILYKIKLNDFLHLEFVKNYFVGFFQPSKFFILFLQLRAVEKLQKLLVQTFNLITFLKFNLGLYLSSLSKRILESHNKFFESFILYSYFFNYYIIKLQQMHLNLFFLFLKNINYHYHYHYFICICFISDASKFVSYQLYFIIK